MRGIMPYPRCPGDFPVIDLGLGAPCPDRCVHAVGGYVSIPTPDEGLTVSGMSNGVGPLHWRGVLTATDLGPLRRSLGDWARRAGVDDATVDGLVPSAYEALANSVEHAYRGELGGMVELDASREGRVVTVIVTDHGSWRPPPADPGSRGRGLFVINSFGATVRVARSTHGTTVTMTWLLDQA
jgi:serine/threonine-protein kinase RsbW